MFIRVDEGTAFDTDCASAREIEALSEAFLKLEERCDELEGLNEELEDRCGEAEEEGHQQRMTAILRTLGEDFERARDTLVAKIKDAIKNPDDRAAITNAVADFTWETNRTLRTLKRERERMSPVP